MANRVVKLSETVLPVYHKWWSTQATYIICKGSRGSGKSKQAALWLITQLLTHPLASALVVRRTERTLRDSCHSDLRWAIHTLGADGEFSSTVSPLEITRPSTGQKILFRGLDDPLKVTSISVPKGVLCYLWCEEFYEIDEASFDTLDESIRGELPPGYRKKVLCTFNPWSSLHFSKKRFFDSDDPDILSMTTTYRDNPKLSPADIKLFEKMKSERPARYQVAGLGEWGVVDGLIFEGWTIDDCSHSPGKLWGGIDFGFSSDPAAVIVGTFDEKTKTIYIRKEIYETGLTNSMLAQRIKRAGLGGVSFTADSAEPKSIAELRSLGLNVHACTKGRDSVVHGVQWLQDCSIVVDPSCENTIKELGLYSWAKDRNGTATGQPQDKNNHAIDGLRYGTEPYRKTTHWVF